MVAIYFPQERAIDAPHADGRENSMTTTYDPKITALLCIDFYNDFLSEGGRH
jgi:hypothetical protein